MVTISWHGKSVCISLAWERVATGVAGQVVGSPILEMSFQRQQTHQNGNIYDRKYMIENIYIYNLWICEQNI